MAKFRKKPIVIEAVQMTAQMRQDGGPFPEWALKHLTMTSTEKIRNSQQVYVETPEGKMHVSDGDYIIQGVQKEVYPCKPDIFEASYEVVE